MMVISFSFCFFNCSIPAGDFSPDSSFDLFVFRCLSQTPFENNTKSQDLSLKIGEQSRLV